MLTPVVTWFGAMLTDCKNALAPALDAEPPPQPPSATATSKKKVRNCNCMSFKLQVDFVILDAAIGSRLPASCFSFDHQAPIDIEAATLLVTAFFDGALDSQCNDRAKKGGEHDRHVCHLDCPVHFPSHRCRSTHERASTRNNSSIARSMQLSVAWRTNRRTESDRLE